MQRWSAKRYRQLDKEKCARSVALMPLRFRARYYALGVFVLLSCVAACAMRPLAVPEKMRVQRIALEDPQWQEWARCAVRARRYCRTLEEPKTLRSEAEMQDFERFFALLVDPARRRFRTFQEAIAGVEFIKEREGQVVDATQDRPGSPPGRSAYRVQDCWIVLYATNAQGGYTTDETQAIIGQMAIFCSQEKR
jgi:hypothetical protein